MDRDKFGFIFVESQLEEAAKTLLRSWMPTYIREIELQLDRIQGEIPSPVYYTSRNEFATFPDDRLPTCVVISPGTAGAPKADGEGLYAGWWGLAVGVVAAARDPEATNTLVKIYGAATRAIMIQHPDINNTAHGIEWEDTSFDDIPDPDKTRSIRAVSNVFRVYLVDVVSKYAGPLAPDPEAEPGTDWPPVESVDIQVQRKEE